MSERVTFIEIDLPACGNVYGQSPCTAALGETGDIKCFNTLATCQDRPNYSESVDVLRLAKPSAFLPLGITAVANITSVSYTPSKLMLGESIGVRSTLTITCGDHPFPDTGPGGDLYRDERPYDPYHQGTFWGKIKARHPFLRGRTLRWYTGSASENLDQMERRTFVIDRLEGPATNGQFRIIAKDPLTLTDDKRAQAPRISRGVLSSGLSDTATSFTLSPAGIGNEDYPESGKLAIGGNEIVTFTRSNDTVTITSRGVDNTEQQEHDEDDRVQVVLEYTGEDPADIIYNLLTQYGNTPASFVRLDNWRAETAEFLGRVYAGIIAEPTPVDEIINEILQQAALTIWWDELAETIRLQVLRDITKGSFVYNDDFILGSTFDQRDQPEKRVSRVQTYYGQISPLEGQQDAKNYRNTLLTVSLQSEENHGAPAIRTIYSRWITQFGRTATERLNNLLLSRYSEPPKRYQFALLRDSGVRFPTLGSGLRIESFFNQDAQGLPVVSGCQITQASASDATVVYEAEEVVISQEVDPVNPSIKVVPIDADGTDFNLREAFLGVFAEMEEGNTVVCEVRGGVNVGSSSISSAAIDSGEGWPDVDATMLFRFLPGSVVAGKQGSSGGVVDVNGRDGEPGGLAMRVRASVPYEVLLDNQSTIGGGGGGGGGGSSAARPIETSPPRVFVAACLGGPGGTGAGKEHSLVGSKSALTTAYNEDEFGGDGKQGSITSGGEGGEGGIGTLDGSTVTAGSGGRGGDLGQPGQTGGTHTISPLTSAMEGTPGQGGPPGPAIDGESKITYINEGTILGARIN